MRETFVRKLQKTSTHSYVINIPKDLINQFKWREKQKVEIVFKGKKEIVIKDYKKPKRKKKII
jgi:antitoxin component of MazEF toxin-antitoxin module